MTTVHEHSMMTTTTPARKAPHTSMPSEIWDEDFVFQQNDEQDNDNSPRQKRVRARDAARTMHDEYKEKEPGSSRDLADPLRAWSESPTSPRQRRVKHEENWDDDFVDKVDSPARSGHLRSQRQSRPSEELDQENWDEDFEMGSSSAGAGPSSKRSRNEAAWDSSDEEGDDYLDREHGFNRSSEDDRTVTARSRRRPLGALDNDVPPLPPLLHFLPTIPSGDVPGPYQSSFPQSPSHSVFSIPATTTSGGGRDSITYDSTAHLALSLRRTHSEGSSSPVEQNLAHRFPPVSPHSEPRERRRLRKKSRPPHLDASILELDDRMGPELPFRASTPEGRSCTPPPVTSSTVVSPTTPSSALSPTTPSSKSPLLTRIGSMKRWGVGVRRKRALTSAADASGNDASGSVAPPSSASVEADRFDNNKTPRPHSHVPPMSDPSTAAPVLATSGRFFRGPAGGMAEGAPMRASLGFEGMDMSRARSRSREPLHVIVPGPIQSQTSQSSGSDVAASPRKARIKAFGHRLFPGTGRNGSPERRAEKGNESPEGGSRSSLTHTPPNPSHPLPLSEATPTRLRPRIPHQLPSTLRTHPLFPRHVSGPSPQDIHAHAHFVQSNSSRSVSANAASSSDELSHSDRNSDKHSDKKEGHRGFMGSIRRISLIGGQKRRCTGQSSPAEESADSHAPFTLPDVPPLPAYPVDTDPLSDNTLLPPAELHAQALLPDPGPASTPIKVVLTAVPTSLSLPVDLTSPSSSPPRIERIPTLAHSKSSSFATSSASFAVPSPVSRLSSSTLQAASLGRASPLLSGTGSASNVHRRNSLGDLKIPSRISRAQDGLKRDLGRVREFAAHVELMKELRTSYYTLATYVQTILEASRPPSRATSPTNAFSLSRPSSRARSNTNPQPPPPIDYRSLATSFQTIDSKYRVAWECADLLIELGTGSSPETTHPMPVVGSSKSAPMTVPQKNRERAITLAGDEGKPDLSGISVKSAGPPPALLSWRASTGRHDLGQRQLFLLKEMLNNAESAKEGTRLDIPDSTQWGWDEAMESSLTLPTEESVVTNASSQTKKRRGSKLGMTGIRDMLRSLKRSRARASQLDAAPSSSTLSTESSIESRQRHFENRPCNTVAGLPVSSRSAGRRRAKTSTGNESELTRSPEAEYDPYMGGISLTHKSSPRRPSLASLFRLGQKHRASPASSSEQNLEREIDISSQAAADQTRTHTLRHEDDGSDSDWDRMDSTSDIEAQIEAIAAAINPKDTQRLRKKKRLSSPLPARPVTPKNLFSSSQASADMPDQSHTNSRSPRLSNVDENNVSMTPSGSGRQTPATPESGKRPLSRGKDRPFSSVRTLPPKPNKSIPVFDVPPVPDLKLAMTPENIKPLLENARVVTARLHDCIVEAKELLARITNTTTDVPSSSMALPSNSPS